MGYLHFPIVNYISKMESWPSIFFYYDKIIKLDKVDSTIILVNKKRWILENISSDSYRIRLSIEDSLFNLFHCELWASTIIWCRSKLIILVLFVILLILVWFLSSFFFDFAVWLCFSLMRTETWVRKIIFKKHFFDIFIEWKTLTLNIGLIFFVRVVHGLIWVDIEPFESIEDIFDWTLNVTILF